MNQKRQPKGTKDGGKFAPDVNQESTVVLSDDGLSENYTIAARASNGRLTVICEVSTVDIDSDGHDIDNVQPTATAYAEAHTLYERGGRALTDRQSPLEQAHIHAQLASDYMKASANAGGSETYLGHRHELAAKSHNSAGKAWQRLYDHKGDEASAVQASQRAAESGRKAADEAWTTDAIDVPKTPAIRFGPGGIREWYEDGEFVPPPIGTEIDVNEARALPSYTEVMATFDATGDREFRLMARGLPRYSDAEHPTDSRLSRRFTNLDTGFEVFVGGEDGMNSLSSTVNLTRIRVSAHG